MWDCTDTPFESAWRDLQMLAVPETVLLLSPATLERYREVSLLPTSLIDAEQLLASGLRGLALNELVDQLVSEEMARSLNAFHKLLDMIEHKRIR